MKYLAQIGVWLGVLALAGSLFIGCAASDTAQQSNAAAVNQASSGYNIDDLDQYGMWITVPPYGEVWRPNVTADWRPFTFGHWDYTPPNWTWVSYEPFGWIVYHYGNWFYAPGYGWLWMPGNGPWSPARVEWMTYDDFVCWAPLPPQGIIYPEPWERYDNEDVWNVVRARDFTSDNVGELSMGSARARPQEQHAQTARRTPDPGAIERYSGRPVPRVNIPREPVKVGKQQLHRMQPPQDDQQRAAKYRPQVEQHVTKNNTPPQNTAPPKNTGNERNTGNRR